MKLLTIAITFAILISLAITAAVVADEAASVGKITVGTDVSEWDVGSGQENGEFVVSKLQGIELGLRAQERFVGPIAVTGDRGNRVGVYEAATVNTVGGNNGTWNYDWHVDLSNATGNATGKTLDDYTLVLEQDFTDESLFGVLGFDPVQLPLLKEGLGGVCDPGTFTETLCQQSWNPGFGNDDFDPDEERTYTLRLVLTPETFQGPLMAVVIRVNVSD